jgi:hypothetical protein
MATEQPQADSTPEERLAAYFTAPEAAAEPESVEQTEATAETEEATEDDGSDDLDLDGLVIRVPKEAKAKISEWKEGHLRREDYTRKTQELADIARQNKLVAEALQNRQAFDTETQKDREQLSQIQADLARYKEVDWSGLEVETYIKLKGQYDSLREKASEIKEALSSKQKEFQEKAEKQRQSTIQEGAKYLKKVIPNFNKDSIDSARSSALSNGYTDQELENVYDARFVALAWKAAQYDRLQESKTAAVASVQKAPPVVKPGAGMGQGVATERRYKDARADLKKSGSTDAFARALLAKGFK